MYKFYMLILLIELWNPLKAQNLIPYGEIGSFQSASSLSINQAGFIFIADAGTNEIIKLDTLGNILKVIGGYGWSASAFDYPTDIFANTLNVYVADRNNDRIQIFDKDLNYLSEISSKKYSDQKFQFRYPMSISVNSQGDLFILDSDNTRILKYNFRGDFLTEIGGYESSSYVLTNPKGFAINNSNQIFVIDSQDLIVYDQFGNYAAKRKLESNFKNINSFLNIITLSGDKNVDAIIGSVKNLFQETKSFNTEVEEKIIDSVIFNNRMYLLTEKTIFLYQFIN
ncbi:MAG: NHL repeat-containing protein [Melioribacteraceae bacterium]|nr:NHL repeat-containing protein [Melioribacteraceae bacterium]